MGRKRVHTACKAPACQRPHLAKGYCQRHYHRYARPPRIGSDTRYDGSPKGKYRYIKRSAKTRGVPFNLTLEDYGDILRATKGLCYYCAAELPSCGHGLDRIDSKRGYTIDNVRPCCTDCNRAKAHMSEYLFLCWAARVGQKAMDILKRGVKGRRAVSQEDENG